MDGGYVPNKALMSAMVIPSFVITCNVVLADPGVARSIVSDVDNLLRLIKVFNVLPPGWCWWFRAVSASRMSTHCI